MKKMFVIISFLCTGLVARSQNLTLEGTAPSLYITHTVAPKENFYSVGRLYNQAPKSIASFNNLVMEKGLSIGQHIKIPLNEQNLDISEKSNPGETVPLTHIVGKNETLSKIGTDLNVSAQTIKHWNNLASDNIAPGTPLVVGHLKMSSSAGIAKAATNPAVISRPEAAKQEAVAENKQVTAEPKKEALAISASSQDSAATPAEKPESARQTEVAANVGAKESPAKQITSATETKKPENYSYATANNTGSIEGVFAGVFTTDASQKAINNKSGEAATFKSTSGWQDKKYYILMNDAAPGTIVKISSTENKVVYAKVLGSMPEMKENNGLLLRISNAAASYLGIIDPRFPVQISYYQ
ncbi:MAG: LysM peptidoglycan-binding domain-containing protein [Segetibacter sp.]